MATQAGRDVSLSDENANLRARLEEAEATLDAIRKGEVDAMVVGEQIYMLTTAEAASNQLRGRALSQVSDAVLTIDNDSRVTWMNATAEHVEACAVRETKEETNLDVVLDGLFGAYMAMDDPRVRVVLLLYKCHRVGGDVRAGDDASDARFFPLDKTPTEIAFKAHEQALGDLLRSS